MIPEIKANDTISFMDTMVARENTTQRDSTMTRDYESISNERQNNFDEKNINEQNIKAESKSKPEQDPVKVHKVTSEIVNKVKKLVQGEDVEPIDEAELEELGELYFLLINIVEARINEHVEVTTGEIAHIDLKAEGAIEAILTHANLLEATKDLGVKVEQLAQQLLPAEQIVEEVQIQLTPGLVQEVHVQVDDLVIDYQQEINIELDLKETLKSGLDLTDIRSEARKDLGLVPEFEDVELVTVKDEVVSLTKKRQVNPLELKIMYAKDVLEPMEDGEIKETKVVYQAINPKTVKQDTKVEIKAGEVEIEAELDLAEAKVVETKVDTKKDIELKESDFDVKEIKVDLAKQKPVMVNEVRRQELETDVETFEKGGDEVTFEDLMSDSASGDSSGDDGTAALATKQDALSGPMNRLAPKFATIKPIDVASFVQEQVLDAPRNSRQEIKLQLNPETWGKIELTITKNENNEVSIKMVFQDGNSLHNMKTQLKDSLVELKSALRENNLDLSKFEVGQSRSSSTAYDGQAQSDSFTETEDKQRERLLNRPPEWLRAAQSANRSSFETVTEGI